MKIFKKTAVLVFLLTSYAYAEVVCSSDVSAKPYYSVKITQQDPTFSGLFNVGVYKFTEYNGNFITAQSRKAAGKIDVNGISIHFQDPQGGGLVGPLGVGSTSMTLNNYHADTPIYLTCVWW